MVASYVGQTGRKLKTSISKHFKRNTFHIKRNTSLHSAITEHRTHYNHEFRWNKMEILDVKKKF